MSTGAGYCKAEYPTTVHYYKQLAFVLSLLVAAGSYAAEPTVRCLLFYRPSCGPCHAVIKQALPPLIEKYRSQLQIGVVDVDSPMGRTLFDETTGHLNLPDDRYRVPLLIVGDVDLLGIQEIDRHADQVVAEYLAGTRVQGEIDIPRTSAVHVLTLDDIQSMLAPRPETFAENFQNNVFGNIVGIGVFLALLITWIWGSSKLILANRRPRRVPPDEPPRSQPLLIAGFATIGFSISLYLSFLERQTDDPFCQLMGNCVKVWESNIAGIFGFPIAWLGVLGYGSLLTISLLVGRQPRFEASGSLMTFLLTNVGILFSIFLTYSQPFLIGIICPWCLASAVTMLILYLVALPPGIARAVSISAPAQTSATPDGW